MKVFGIPIDTLLAVLVVALAGASGSWRCSRSPPDSVKLGVATSGAGRLRHRRRLMLGTTIVPRP
jgi:hypothetical protein